MAQKRKKTAVSIEMKRRIDLAQDRLDEDTQVLYAEYGGLVTTWIHNELTNSRLSFEEIAVALARNFMLAHSIGEMTRIGQRIENALDDHTVSDAA